MKAYIFKCKGSTLAPILASNTEEAWEKLPMEHAWIEATKDNSFLSRVVSIEKPLGFDALLPCY